VVPALLRVLRAGGRRRRAAGSGTPTGALPALRENSQDYAAVQNIKYAAAAETLGAAAES